MDDRIAWARLRRSGLVEPFGSAEETARRLLGVQAQLAPAAALAFRNRTAGVDAADLDDARLGRRSLVRLWGQRDTLHLYDARDWPFLHTVLAERRTLVDRRVKKLGVAAEFRRVLRRTAKRLADGALLTYKDVTSKKLADAVPNPRAVPYLVFMQLVRDGVACHAEERGAASVFAHRARWLPDLDWAPPPPQDAQSEAARRYLAAYGPAGPADLAFWCGTSQTNAKRWLAAAGDPDDDPGDAPPPRSRWPVRMLYRFDPLLLATRDKSWLVDDAHYKKVWRKAAHVEAVLLAKGRIAGTWRYDRKAAGLDVTLTPFAKLPKTTLRAAEREAAAAAAFLGPGLRSFTVA